MDIAEKQKIRDEAKENLSKKWPFFKWEIYDILPFSEDKVWVYGPNDHIQSVMAIKATSFISTPGHHFHPGSEYRFEVSQYADYDAWHPELSVRKIASIAIGEMANRLAAYSKIEQ